MTLAWKERFPLCAQLAMYYLFRSYLINLWSIPYFAYSKDWRSAIYRCQKTCFQLSACHVFRIMFSISIEVLYWPSYTLSHNFSAVIHSNLRFKHDTDNHFYFLFLFKISRNRHKKILSVYSVNLQIVYTSFLLLLYCIFKTATCFVPVFKIVEQ